MGKTQHKHRKTIATAALSSSSAIGEGELSTVGTEDAGSEDASYASLIEAALSVYSQVDLFD